MKDAQQIKRTIMRRVYYAFGLRLAFSMTTLHLVILAAAVYALGYFVHVSAVLQNVSRQPVGEFGPYMLKVVMQADVITLLVTGVIIMTALSLPFTLPQYRRTLHPRVHA